MSNRTNASYSSLPAVCRAFFRVLLVVIVLLVALRIRGLFSLLFGES